MFGGWARFFARLQGIVIYAGICLVPFMLYPISINGNTIDLRMIREISMFTLGFIFVSLLQKNKILVGLFCWIAISWWGHCFLPNGSSNLLVILSMAIVIQIVIRKLIREGILKIDTILKLICGMILFSIAWSFLQYILKYDPVFMPVNSDGQISSCRVISMIGWSGNTSLFGIFIACFSFLLLPFFAFKKWSLFWLVIPFIIYTKNATTFIAFASGYTFYLYHQVKDKKRFIQFLMVGIIAAIIFFTCIKMPNIDRFPLWKSAMQMLIATNPILGLGPNSYGAVNFWKDTTPWHELHNEYLQIAFEFGIPALLLFLAFIWSKFVEFGRCLKSEKQVAMASCVVAFLASSFSLFPMHIAQMSFTLLLVWACLEESYDTDSSCTIIKQGV
jgi:hypothetical protein